MPAKAGKAAKAGTGGKTAKKGLSDVEKAAVRDYLKEKRGEAGDGPTALRAAIAAMPPEERALAQRMHDLVMAAAPGLEQRTWYGFPAYAKDGKVICFFKPGAKFKERYCTFGFNTPARLDDGGMWATSFAVTKPSASDEAKLSALVKKAAGA